MADKKITALNNITGANLANTDEFVVVDISADETMAVTRAEFFKNTPSIDVSGTVTISGSTPKLRVADTDAADRYSDFYNSNGATYIETRNGASNSSILFRGRGGGATTEYARFDSVGNLGLGTANPTGTLHVNGNTYFGNPPDALPSNNASGSGATISSGGKLSMLGDSDWCLGLGRHTTSGPLQYFYYSGSVVGSIAVTASVTNYNTSSDYRLKENITPVQGASDIVKAMQPVTYTFKSDGSWHDGFLAHELQELHPRAVVGEKDAMRDEEYEVTPAVLDDDGNVVTEAVMGTRSVPDYQGVDYSKLTPILTAALQEALNKIDALEARLIALESL